METPYLQDVPGYLVWANGRVLQMLRGTDLADDRRIFAHILGAERVWAARLLGEPMPCPVWPEWTLDECEPLIAENGETYRKILAVRSLDEPVAYRNSRGEPFDSSVDRILVHVISHGSYHRGQIGQDVRRVGGELLDTDYILFPGDVITPGA